MNKKLLAFIVLGMLAFTGYGQVYQQMAQYGYGPVKRFWVDSTLSIPTICGTPTLKSYVNKTAAIAFDSCNKRFYYYDPKLMMWDTIKGGGGISTDTTSLSNRINQKIEDIIRSSDSVYFYKNGVKTFAYKDSIGGGSGFVPYTGATQDVDLGANGIDAKFMKITGTAGNGHIDLKHQSGDATGQANSTKLYANSSGYLKWKNDNLYYSTLAMPQTADRVYTYQNKSYTLGDSADIAARVKYTDTAAMLTNYAKSISVSPKMDSSKFSSVSNNYIPYKSNYAYANSPLQYSGNILKSTSTYDRGIKLDFGNEDYKIGDTSYAYLRVYKYVETPKAGAFELSLQDGEFTGPNYLSWNPEEGMQLYAGSINMTTVNGTNINGANITGNTNISNLYLYEQANGGYGSIALSDNMYTFKDAGDNTIFSAEGGNLNINGTYNTTITNVGSTSANRVNYLPDRNGTFMLTEDTANMLKAVYMLKDTLPIATFAMGSGAAGDTTAFTTSAIVGSFYNDGTDTLFITSYRVAVQGTSASVTPDVWFNDSLNVTAGGTKLVNSPSAITNSTTGTSVTPNTNKIPPGNFVFVKFNTVTTKPTYFTLTLLGTRLRK